jgi:S-adenosylmethionine hydrolase
MHEPIVTLTTDFGAAGPYVGAMKGVILSFAPRARIVDITHEITPFAVPEAAFVLAQACPLFPCGTIHVAVVDPGVGTSRRPILAEAEGQCFVAPDNGVLSLALAGLPARVREITAESLFRQPVSRTFHGRDVFAPVAAHLARGMPPSRAGRLVTNYQRLELDRPLRLGPGRWRGAVLALDRFGNLITSFRIEDFRWLARKPFALRAGRRTVRAWREAYGEAAPGELFVIAGSAGYLEIAANQDSAARLTGCAAGSQLDLRELRRIVPGRGSSAR